MTAQPADHEAKPVAPKYSQKTLLRIRHARTGRDLILCIGGVVFAVLSFVIPVPSYTVNDPIWIFALVIAVVFGFAAWTEVWFYLLTGLAIFLQSLFALCVLIFGRKPKSA